VIDFTQSLILAIFALFGKYTCNFIHKKNNDYFYVQVFRVLNLIFKTMNVETMYKLAHGGKYLFSEHTLVLIKNTFQSVSRSEPIKVCSKQGDQIGRNFVHWAIVFFGQVFENDTIM
jgi:hypothetical protein